MNPCDETRTRPSVHEPCSTNLGTGSEKAGVGSGVGAGKRQEMHVLASHFRKDSNDVGWPQVVLFQGGAYGCGGKERRVGEACNRQAARAGKRSTACL